MSDQQSESSSAISEKPSWVVAGMSLAILAALCVGLLTDRHAIQFVALMGWAAILVLYRGPFQALRERIGDRAFRFVYWTVFAVFVIRFSMLAYESWHNPKHDATARWLYLLLDAAIVSGGAALWLWLDREVRSQGSSSRWDQPE